MPRTTKTSTGDTKAGDKTRKSVLDELGINEPYINPNPNGGFFRYNGKWYTRDNNGEIIRHYPPGEKRPRTKTKVDK